MSSPVELIVNHPLFRVAAPIYLRRGWKSQVMKEDAARLRDRSWTDKVDYERFWKPLMRAVWFGSIEDVAESISEHRGDLEPREASILLRRAMASVVRRSFEKYPMEDEFDSVRQDRILALRDFPLLPPHGVAAMNQIQWVCSISARLSQWLRLCLDMVTTAPRWCISTELQTRAEQIRAMTADEIAEFSAMTNVGSDSSDLRYLGLGYDPTESIVEIGQRLVGSDLLLTGVERNRLRVGIDFVQSSAATNILGAVSAEGIFLPEMGTNASAPSSFFTAGSYPRLLWNFLNDRARRFYFNQLVSDIEGLPLGDIHRIVQEAMIGRWPDNSSAYGDALIDTICDAIESYPLETQQYVDMTRSVAQANMQRYQLSNIPGIERLRLLWPDSGQGGIGQVRTSIG